MRFNSLLFLVCFCLVVIPWPFPRRPNLHEASRMQVRHYMRNDCYEVGSRSDRIVFAMSWEFRSWGNYEEAIGYRVDSVSRYCKAYHEHTHELFFQVRCIRVSFLDNIGWSKLLYLSIVFMIFKGRPKPTLLFYIQPYLTLQRSFHDSNCDLLVIKKQHFYCVKAHPHIYDIHVIIIIDNNKNWVNYIKLLQLLS